MQATRRRRPLLLVLTCMLVLSGLFTARPAAAQPSAADGRRSIHRLPTGYSGGSSRNITPSMKISSPSDRR